MLDVVTGLLPALGTLYTLYVRLPPPLELGAENEMSMFRLFEPSIVAERPVGAEGTPAARRTELFRDQSEWAAHTLT